MKFLKLLFLLIFLLPAQSASGYMIADISAQKLIKGVDFTGQEVSISGVSDDNSHIIAVLSGPINDVQLWKKKKKIGVWAKHGSHVLKDVPFFLAVASSPNIGNLPLSLTEEIKIDHNLKYLPNFNEKDLPFFHELINIKQKSNLYQKAIIPIETIGQQIFRFKVYIPIGAITGPYHVAIYKIIDGKIADKVNLELEIGNIGFDYAIKEFARNSPLEYGIMAVVVSLLIGSMIGYMFRKDR
jgi:uncharacterized protein (TIGR02186 family)